MAESSAPKTKTSIFINRVFSKLVLHNGSTIEITQNFTSTVFKTSIKSEKTGRGNSSTWVPPIFFEIKLPMCQTNFIASVKNMHFNPLCSVYHKNM